MNCVDCECSGEDYEQRNSCEKHDPEQRGGKALCANGRIRERCPCRIIEPLERAAARPSQL